MNSLPAAHAASVKMVSGADYLSSLMAHVTQAKHSVRVLQYILDTRSHADPDHRVGYLMRALAIASARGVEVGIVLHAYTPDAGAHQGNLAGALFLARRGVGVRMFRPSPAEQRRTLHAKTAIVDERIAIVGSQNWSPGAFGTNAETAAVIDSPAIARQLGQFFDGMWQRSEEPQP